MALRDQETKRYVIGNASIFPIAVVGSPLAFYYQRHIFAGLQDGASNYLLEGNELLNPRVTLKLNLSVDWRQLLIATAGALAPVYFHVWLVAVADEWLQAGAPYDFSLMTTIQMQSFFQQSNPARVTTEGQYATVIRHWKYKAEPDRSQVANSTGTNYTGQVSSRALVCKARLRGKKEFQLFSTTNLNPGDNPTRINMLKGYQYYWVVGGGLPDWTANAAVSFGFGFQADQYVYFKDP